MAHHLPFHFPEITAAVSVVYAATLSMGNAFLSLLIIKKLNIKCMKHLADNSHVFHMAIFSDSYRLVSESLKNHQTA